MLDQIQQVRESVAVRPEVMDADRRQRTTLTSPYRPRAV
ncbi:hypothetical protein SBI_09371 [Streptomyces bingchenggensis BCW-1]|uniref:Uncharacterized protein n=1 Tax=Streptomyces bingchenggensis (strain BCW-1) TaxID=749414 RepID=D7C5W0_STRBB|nr:hypothetical protein SBI_09371 [Streptomyces bingchenggensis BCW-1]